MMELGNLPSGAASGLATLNKALTNPKVQSLAGLFNIDLNNQVQRNAVLAYARSNLAAATYAAAVQTVAAGAVPTAAPARPVTAYYAQQAIQAYRDVAAL
ncbi:MAG: hypothetical protein NT083_01020 [Rhodocyclales bacterium]|nr:hypothetical protein [Rhodocyclales bacterium]